MKRFQFVITFCFIFLHLFCSAQFVILQNKKFKLENGIDFYPLLVNYHVEITSANNGTSWGIAPYGSYGSSSGYECGPAFSDCPAAVLRDLQHIKNMGFNGIRLWMTPVKEHDAALPQHSIPGFINRTQCYPTGCNLNFRLSSPYMTDANTQLFFSKVDEVLALCNQVVNSAGVLEPLKAKLLCGVGRLANDDDAINDYAEFLIAMGYYFTNISTHSSTIMAYDLWNEPAWVNDPTEHFKKDVCEIVDKWYSSIRTYDKKHLISMGLNSFNDVFEWDKAIMSLDFVSEHIYPSFLSYEGYDYDLAMERFHNELIWTKNNCPIPWMIGETSFRASSSADADHSKQPYIAGAETDPVNHHGQDDFMEFLLNEVRDAGGAGCSWWQFGDVWWDPDDPDKWVGLVRLADPIPNYASITKPCSTKVLDFDPKNIQSLNASTASYNNPLNHPSNPLAISGHVQDQDGNPIKDAVVRGWTVLDLDTDDPSDLLKAKLDLHYVFTDENGNFEIRPYDYHITPLDPPEREIIEAINISAYGCDRFYANWGPSTLSVSIGSYDPFQPSTFPNPIVLKRQNFKYDGIIQNTSINTSNNQKFRGYNSLTVSNVEINSGGIADFTSHNEINVKQEFNAKRGSETYIYTSASECTNSLLNTFQRIASSDFHNHLNENKTIDLEFKKSGSRFDIYPNPNSGKFNVSVFANDKGNAEYEIIDMVGRRIIKSQIESNTFELELPSLTKGIYFIRMSFIDKQMTEKIIIN